MRACSPTCASSPTTPAAWRARRRALSAACSRRRSPERSPAACGAGSSPWPLLAVLLGLAYGRLEWRAAGWRLRDGRLAIRTRRLAQVTVLAPARNRESHALAQSVLQRRGRLADLEVAFGKKTKARIRHLDVRDAWAAWEALD